ncbi:MAG: hypothetical protein Q8M83_03670 [bacterium]|nr:hypothetical protein [bacterium]
MFGITLKFLVGLALDAGKREIHLFPIPKDQAGQPNAPGTTPEYNIYYCDPDNCAFSYEPDLLPPTAKNFFVTQAGRMSLSERAVIPLDLGDGQKVTTNITITPTPFGDMMIIKIRTKES